VSSEQQRIRVVWTATAVQCLGELPKKVRAGLLAKADELAACWDPRAVHKPLVGPLAGLYRITYARYRAIYKVTEDEIANGDVIVTITVCFIAAGIRKEHSKDDVYKVVEKIVRLGIVDPDAEK